MSQKKKIDVNSEKYKKFEKHCYPPKIMERYNKNKVDFPPSVEYLDKVDLDSLTIENLPMWADVCGYCSKERPRYLFHEPIGENGDS